MGFGQKNQTSSGTSSGTATTTLSPQVQAAYNSLLTQLGGVSSGTNAATNAATSGLGALAANDNPGYLSAATTLAGATAPAYASISNYLSPYLSGALQTQIASQNQQNAQQQQQVLGNAAAQGALGGNRVGIAQSQLAGQQDIANNAANSSLINSAYQQAENSALSGQQNQIAAGAAQTNLGSSTNASTLSDLLGQLSGGSSQFSNLGTLGNIASGLSNSGQTISSTGTTSQTQPAGNWLSSLVGAGLGIAGLFNKGGVVPGYDAGGSIGNTAALMSAINGAIQGATPQNDNQPNGANDNSPFGNLASPEQMKAGASNIRGWLAPSSSMPLGLGETGGFGSSYRRGGIVGRRGYDDGGYVEPPPAYMSALLDQITNAPDTGPSSYGSAPMQPMMPESGFAGLNDQIASAPASITPALIGNSDVTMPSSAVNGIDGLASRGLPAMIKQVQPQPGVLANPSLQTLPPGITPQTRMVARDQQMAAQGFSVPGLGAVAAADEQAYNLPPGYLSRTAQIESNGNPSATNPSGATGLMQFMPATAKQYGLTNPLDPVASTNAAAQLASDNQQVLAKGLGRAPTASELYLAHQQGAGGALNLLRNPGAPAASIIGLSAVTQNGGTPDMTAGQFASMWENKFGNGDTGVRGTVPTATTASGAPAGGVPGGLGVTPPGGYGVPDSNAGYATTLPQVLESLKAGKGLNLSPDAREALLSAGAGMMAGKSPFALTNIGTGVQAGLNQWQTQQATDRENALANSAIGAQQGELGISGQQLVLNAQQTAAQVAQEIAAANATRYPVMMTPYGPAFRDVEHPEQGATIAPWNMPGGGASAGNGAGAPPVSQLPTDADGFVTSAPPMDTTHLNPMMMTPEGRQTLLTQSAGIVDPAVKGATAAQDMDVQLGQMADLAKQLPDSGVLSQGAGFTARTDLVKSLNAALSVAGIAPVDPSTVGTAEDINKMGTKLQAALATSWSSDPAMGTIMKAASASPSGENTKQGFFRILGGIGAVNKRAEDKAAFLQDWRNQHYGDMTGAINTFNQVNPPQKYVQYGDNLSAKLSGGTAQNPIIPTSQADIDNAAPGSVFRVNGKLMVKR